VQQGCKKAELKLYHNFFVIASEFKLLIWGNIKKKYKLKSLIIAEKISE